MQYVKFLNEVSKKSIPVAGGKCANLGEMAKIGLPVPPTFVITSIALKKILPKKLWIRVNRLFVKFGQQICLPISPKCNDICPINDICPKDFTMEELVKKKREARKK